jgi:hypothetical protein
MPASGPGRDDPRALSQREKQILARIEEDLAVGDPYLARQLRRPPRWWPLSAWYTALLVPAQAVLLAVSMLMPDSWLAVTCLILTLVVMPGLLLSATERRCRGKE